MTTYYTSDTHFGHANIIRHSGRPFADVDEMDRVLVDRWNSRVKPEDTVYHLGDFVWGNGSRLQHYLSQLNGEIVLVKGNHDQSTKKLRDVGLHVVDATFLSEVPPVNVFGFEVCEIWAKMIAMAHSPHKLESIYDSGGQGDVYLCGHVHERWSYKDYPFGRVHNVGVDVRGFQPITLDEILAADNTTALE